MTTRVSVVNHGGFRLKATVEENGTVVAEQFVEKEDIINEHAWTIWSGRKVTIEEVD